MRAHAAVLACVVSLGLTANVARAESPVTTEEPPPPPEASKPIVVWPTQIPEPDDAAQEKDKDRKKSERDHALADRATELDATIRDAVQDLGFALDVADPGPAQSRSRDLDMVERAQRGESGTFVVNARLEPVSSDAVVLRLIVVPPKQKQLRMRVERVNAADLSVRGLVLLRELLTTNSPTPIDMGPKPQENAGAGIMSP